MRNSTSAGFDDADQAVFLFHNACGEENVVADDVQSPELVQLERRLVRFLKPAEKGAGRGIVAVNQAVAEISNEQGPAETSEAVRSERQAPGRIELAARDEMIDEGTIGVEDSEITVPAPRHIVLTVRGLVWRR